MRTPTGRNLTYDLREGLGRAIVGGAYEDGFPTEAELSKTYGLSRSVTREAVKMLSAKGLLSARPRLGTVVEPDDKWNLLDPDVLRWLLQRKFSLDLLHHFSQLRLGIEPTAAALAAQAGDGDAIAEIEAGFRRMEAAAAGEDDALEADVQFHISILHATDNPFFRQFEEMVRTALHTSIQFTNRFVGRSADIAEHGAVLAAIRAGDSERASTAMRKLIADVLVLIDQARAQPADDSAVTAEPEEGAAAASC